MAAGVAGGGRPAVIACPAQAGHLAQGAHRFSFRGGPEITNDTQYQDIIDNRRIVITYRMTIGGKPLSVSLATMEFFPHGKGTRVTYTEQGAYFDSADSIPGREHGCTALFERLAEELEKFP